MKDVILRKWLYTEAVTWKCCGKKGFRKNLAKFAEKHLCQSLCFNKLETLLNERLRHRCFHVNFVKFLRPLFFNRTTLVAAFVYPFVYCLEKLGIFEILSQSAFLLQSIVFTYTQQNVYNTDMKKPCKSVVVLQLLGFIFISTCFKIMFVTSSRKVIMTVTSIIVS